MSSSQRAYSIAHGLVEQRRRAGKRQAELKPKGCANGRRAALNNLAWREAAELLLTRAQLFGSGQSKWLRDAGERTVGEAVQYGGHELMLGWCRSRHELDFRRVM